MKEIHKISCKCGKFHGTITNIECGVRAICYCKDCQTYARYLSESNEPLNSFGGTEVVAVRPKQIAIASGYEYLSCVSLTEFGSLRFFARCCATPICNMSRNVRTAHVSVIHRCLEHGATEPFFGKSVIHVKRNSAIGIPPKNNVLFFLVSALCYSVSVFWFYVGHSYRRNPFINKITKAPIVNPIILTADELNNLKNVICKKHKN